jgi:hypothetical protein
LKADIEYTRYPGMTASDSVPVILRGSSRSHLRMKVQFRVRIESAMR